MTVSNPLFRLFILFFFLLAASGVPKTAAAQSAAESDSAAQTVLIHPVIETGTGELIFSREHTYKKQLQLGDQLARDFVVAGATKDGILKFFENNGKQNKDYLSWRKNVLAPVAGTVQEVTHPDTTNKPGVMNRKAEPGVIQIRTKNGASVTVVHVREIEVEEGQQVQAGEVIAKVGNNGNSTGPHIHVGAWKGDTPLQIQVDLYAAAK